MNRKRQSLQAKSLRASGEGGKNWIKKGANKLMLAPL